MGKKLKTQKKANNDSTPKSIDFSSLINQSQEKLSHQNFPAISLNTVKFNINPSGSDLEKKYHKKYTTYFHEEFNSKIIKMYFNYISSSKIINQTVKDNRPFLIDFLKIITNLLMNEIELSAMAFLLENKVKWLGPNETDLMWNHLYNVCLKAKQITSSNEIFEILINILDAQNPGFKSHYNKWVVIKNCPNDLKIDDINKVYSELMQSNYLNQNKSKFINYNEAVNQILKFSEKPVKNKKKKGRKYIGNKEGNNINNNMDNVLDFPHNQNSIFLEPNYPSNLNISKNASNENFELNFQKSIFNNNLGLSNRNFSTYYMNNINNIPNYSNLNLMKNDSGRSFNSLINDQNNNNFNN
jgi:hypothetical protein